ncbi:MAG: DUF3667 domain-containing protein [Muribaculaceae bacterium]|nr:DUF3667 domain-containing protein [Muribaculaceae bacterium]
MENESTFSDGVKNCLNCGTEYQGDYCHNCGQHISTGRLASRDFFASAVLSLLRVNRGFGYTACHLLYEPWAVIRNYIHGKRVIYTAPVPLLIVLCLFGTLIPKILGTHNVFYLDAESIVLPGDLPSERIINAIIHFYAVSPVFQALTMYIPYVFAAMVVYRKSGAGRFNLAEYAVAMIYMANFVIISEMVLLPVSLVSEGVYTALSTLLQLVMGGIVLDKAFPQRTRLKAVWKVFLFLLISQVVMWVPVVLFGLVCGMFSL